MNIKDVAAINKTARPISGKRGKQQVPRSLLDAVAPRITIHSLPVNPGNLPRIKQRASGISNTNNIDTSVRTDRATFESCQRWTMLF